jgi:hypothetical protein
MCLPVAHASISFGEALLNFITQEKSCIETLPVPPPPAGAVAAAWDSPQLQASTSISFTCLLSVLSPSIPSSLRK